MEERSDNFLENAKGVFFCEEKRKSKRKRSRKKFIGNEKNQVRRRRRVR